MNAAKPRKSISGKWLMTAKIASYLPGTTGGGKTDVFP